MIEGLSSSGSIPTLERLAQFASSRHRLITHNIANISTPNFQPLDVSVPAFQAALRDAIEDRRRGNAPNGELRIDDSPELKFHDTGIELNPKPAAQNLLFHDGNDRDLDRMMQDLVENFTVFRQASQLLKSRYQVLNEAIRERL